MEFAKMGQNLAKSITGSNVKAVLCIRDVSKIGDKIFVPQKSADGDSSIDQMMSKEEKDTIASAEALNQALIKRAQQSLKGGSVATFSDIKKIVAGTDDKTGEKYNFIALEVQYNPSSLRLDTTAGRQRKYEGGQGDVRMQTYDPPVSTTLSCELIFDDFNNMDAFMLSDNPLTGMTASNVANSVVNNFTKTKHSVQRQMEGLMAMLAVPAARHVIFYWGELCFRGEVTELVTKYTMFNKKGYPIRGTVGMQIRQGDGSDPNGPDAPFMYDEKYWLDAFDQTFSTSIKGASTFSKVTNNSLLNLKL